LGLWLLVGGGSIFCRYDCDFCGTASKSRELLYFLYAKIEYIIKISIEEENNTVKIEVSNETTGEPMVVPFDFIRGGEAFKLRKGLYIKPLLGHIEDDRVTVLITENPCYYSEADM